MAATFDNSIDAVAGRDVVCEYAFCCAQAMVDLSRLAEELVSWGTTEFDWVTYDERTSDRLIGTPAEAEPGHRRVGAGPGRHRSRRCHRSHSHCRRRLPLPTERDLQEDKSLVFHADDTLAATLEARAPCSKVPNFIHHHRPGRRRHWTWLSGSPGAGCRSAAPTRQWEACGGARCGWPRPGIGKRRRPRCRSAVRTGRPGGDRSRGVSCPTAITRRGERCKCPPPDRRIAPPPELSLPCEPSAEPLDDDCVRSQPHRGEEV